MKIKGRWRKLGPVYERQDGLRIHIGARILRTSSGDFIPPDYIAQHYWTRVAGSLRRGMMLWANAREPLGAAPEGGEV